LKKNSIILVLPFFLGLCFFSISHAEDKVAMDLVNYVNQGILGIAELEIRSLERYDAVTGNNYTTDERVYKSLNDDVIPLYKRFLELLRDIAPKTKEVINLHRIYVRGAEYINEGFKMKKLGIENKNEGIILQANKKIEKGSDDVRRWKKEIMVLYEKHGVAPAGEKEKKG